MDMDTDWCFTCNRRVEPGSLYCSSQCQNGAGPSNYQRGSLSALSEKQYASCDDYLEMGEGCEEYFEDDLDYEGQQLYNIEAVSKTNWAGRGSAGIRAWAAEIPLGARPDVQELPSPTPSDDSSSISSTSSTSSTYRAPNLVRPSRPVPPSLTMTKPELSTTTPPRPILNLQKHLAAVSLTHSPGSTARTSVASEDSIPTPASAHAMPFSALPGRPFPSISDARACDLAACTQLNSPSTPPRTGTSQKNGDAQIVQSRCVPIASRIVSFPRSSLSDDLDSSPPWWVTNSMVARQATKLAARSSVRKDSSMASEAVRGRRSSRIAA
ncbi:hypothetical protein P691DRAFT_758604 [Macrolepiota fuliginosa MF-IS2]|uniref:Uncharacterized protein n=1 Tax=Macrolepiota fuliginosa MF-IS2 TaxID=1400762 RepID=A0A9P5XFW0_9AGAR|nr:hypothetical protein P691DRAFT_758604 [Macrolepiota fuliginosa MF-IS2]